MEGQEVESKDREVWLITRGKRVDGERHGEQEGRGLMLTCPTHWIVAGGGGEDLRGKVFERHDLSVVLDDGFQVECPLLVADGHG